MKYVRPIRNCGHCHQDRPHEAHGLCKTCYSRRRYPRTDAPNGNSTQRHSRSRDAVESRVDDYRLLRTDPRVSRAEAARRVGISYRTAERYDQRLKDMT